MNSAAVRAEASEMSDLKLMPLRYAGICRTCGDALPAKTKAAYDRDTKTVLCLTCAGSEDRREPSGLAVPVQPVIPQQASPTGSGVAFAGGAIGERKAAEALAELCGHAVLFLINRKLGKERSDGHIDVVAVTSAGVRVIDVKRYKDAAVAVRRTGGSFSPVREQLMIAGRDKTNLLNSLNRRRDAVSSALATFALSGPIAVERGFCFVAANLPMFGTSTIDGVPLLGPKGTAASLNSATGILNRDTRERLHRHLADALPPA